MMFLLKNNKTATAKRKRKRREGSECFKSSIIKLYYTNLVDSLSSLVLYLLHFSYVLLQLHFLIGQTMINSLISLLTALAHFHSLLSCTSNDFEVHNIICSLTFI